MVVMDPINWPRFFVRAVVGLAVGLSEVDGLAISGAVSTGLNVAVGFSELSL